MKIGFKILLALILFAGLTLTIAEVFSPHGQMLTEWKVLDIDKNKDLIDKEFVHVKAPFSQKVDKIGVYQLSTLFYPEDMLADVIHIPRINGYAFEVSLNGQFIFRRGDLEVPTANLWNHSYLVDIPEGLLHQKNILVIRVKALNDIGLIMAPTLTHRNEMNMRVELQNLLTDGSSYMITGSSFILGLMLIFLGFRMNKGSRHYFQFGLSFIFFSFYNFEFTYREFTGSIDIYLWIRKLLLMAILFSIGFLFLGMQSYLHQRTLPKSLQIVYIILSLPLLLASTFQVLRDMIYIYNIGIIVLVSIMIIQILQAKQNKLTFSVTFLIMTIFHTIVVVIFSINTIMILNYGILVMLMSLTYNIILDVGNLQLENMVLNKKNRIDPLTKAYNREYLEQLQYHDYDTLVFIDLDYFKKYNDTYGHHLGDVLLEDFVRIVKEYIRPEDAIIRYGGDEFVIMLQHTPIIAAEQKTESIRKIIIEKFDTIDISYGISQYKESIHETLRLADKYMYRMKEGKRRNR